MYSNLLCDNLLQETYSTTFCIRMGNKLLNEEKINPLTWTQAHSSRSQKSRASALDFSLRAEGVNNGGRVTLRSVLSISLLLGKVRPIVYCFSVY